MRQDTHPGPIVLQSLIDHEATPSETLRVARHLADCPDCDALSRGLAELADDLSSLPGAEVPEGFSARVMGRLSALPAPRRRPRLLRLVAPAVAVAVFVGASLAAPWTIRLAGGVGGWLPEPRSPGEILDLVFALGAAALATLGRAAERLGPWLASPDMDPGPTALAPVSLTLLAGVLAVGLVGVALAGGSLLRLWFRRGENSAAPGAGK